MKPKVEEALLSEAARWSVFGRGMQKSVSKSGKRSLERRVKRWRKVLRHTEPIVAGDQSALIAQSRRDDGVLRAPFLSVGEDRKILTGYWTSRIGKYWKDR